MVSTESATFINYYPIWSGHGWKVSKKKQYVAVFKTTIRGSQYRISTTESRDNCHRDPYDESYITDCKL